MNHKTLYKNLDYYGVDLKSLYDESGQKIAQNMLKDFSYARSYSFILGMGGNAVDGLSTALHLSKLAKNIDINIYLIGRKNSFEHPIGSDFLAQISQNKKITLHNDCYAHDVKQSEVNVEALVGTGLTGTKLNKRFYDVIKRISHFQNKLVAIDIPAPGYTPDITYSLNYSKTYDAVEIKLSHSENYLHLVGPGDVEELWIPNSKTHIKKNGKLLWIGEDLENFELCKQIASEYLVETKGILCTNHENEISFKKINFHESFSGAFDWANHCVFDENKNQDIVLTSVLAKFSENYADKSTIGFQLLEKTKKAGIVYANRNEDKTSLIKKSLHSKIEVGILFDAKIISYFSNEFRVADINFNYRPKLKLIFLYLSSAYSTKNPLWTSVRAAMFQIISSISQKAS